MSSSSTISLLNLPFLCIQKILLNFGLFDLINLSFASKKCRYTIKCSKTSCKRIDFKIEKEKIHFVFVSFNNTVQGSWLFNLCDLKMDRPIKQRIEGIEIDNCASIKSYPFICDDPQHTIKKAIDSLLSLFRKCVIGRICIELDDNISDIEKRRIILPGVNQCKSLIVCGKSLIENEEIRYFLQHFTVTERFLVLSPINSDFCCDLTHFKSRQINFREGASGWLTRDILFRLESPNIQFHECDFSKVSSNDFMDFVDRWYNSNDSSFDLLLLKWKELPEKPNIQRFRPMSWNRKQRNRDFRLYPEIALNCSKGMDIVRNDGLLATILTTRMNALIFYVWKDRFPDVSGCRVI